MKRLRLALSLVAVACHHAASPAPTSVPVRVVTGARAKEPAWTKPGHEPAYFEFQVEKTVLGVPGGPFPTYPPALQAAHVEGRVLVQYVVDTTGVAEPGTVTVLESSDPAFAQAVLDKIPAMRFYPATIGGRKVRQVVQQPFAFAIGR